MRNAVVVMLLCVCAMDVLGAGTGRSAGDFLTIMPNARAAAMGDGTTALLADEPSAVLVNPASLARVTRPWVSFHHLALPGDITYNMTSICLPTNVGTLGATLIHVPYDVSGGYDDTGAAIDLPASHDTAAMISAAIPIKKKLPVYREYGYIGASLKFMHEALAFYSTEAMAFDVGAIVNLPFVRGLTAGAALKNTGTGMKFVTKTNTLPASSSYGVGYHNPSWWDLQVTADALGAANGPPRAAAGISVSPVYFLTLRTSYKDDGDSLVGSMRLGLGLRFNGIALDYALTPQNYYSQKHTISLCLSLGGIARLDAASDYYLTQHYRAACEQYYKKDYIAARQQFEEILSIYPDHLPSQEYLTKIIAAVESDDAKRQTMIENWLIKADDAFDAKDFVTAGKYYRRVLRISANSTMAQGGIDRVRDMITLVKQEKDRQENRAAIGKIWRRAVSRFKKGDFVRAKDDFQDILFVDPGHEEAKKYLVEIDHQLTSIAAARINEMFARGMKLYEGGNYAEAVKYFDAVFIAAPHRLDAQDLSHKAQDAIDTAANKKRQAVVAREQDMVRGEMTTMFDTALKYYEKASYEAAFEWFSKSEKFAAQYEFNEYRESARNYLGLVRNTLAEKHYKRGINLIRAGNRERAADEFKKALDYEPGNSAARTEFEKLRRDIAQYYFERGMEHFSLNQMDKARDMFQKSLQYQPDKAESLRALERIK